MCIAAFRVSIVCVVVSVSVCAASADPPCFRVLNLNPSQDRYVWDVSDDGSVIVGGGIYGWRWERGEAASLPSSTIGGPAYVYAVSGDGHTLVGRFNMGVGPFANDPMRWTPGTGMMPLAGDPLAFGTARDVSNDGSIIVGTLGSNPRRAFRWNVLDGAQFIGALSANGWSDAQSVSVDGTVIVGTSDLQAYRWTAESGMVGLGFLSGYSNSYTRSVSADGRTVVGASGGAPLGEAFRWTQTDGMVGLGFLPGGLSYSSAAAVSGDGSVIVGAASDNQDGDGFVWDAAHGMRVIQQILENDYGLTLGVASLPNPTGVSADGLTIVGDNVIGSFGWVARLWEHDTYCEGDLNGDNVVDLTDLAILLAAFGDSKAGDYDCDCRTDLDDLALLLSNFGNSCP